MKIHIKVSNGHNEVATIYLHLYRDTHVQDPIPFNSYKCIAVVLRLLSTLKRTTRLTCSLAEFNIHFPILDLTLSSQSAGTEQELQQR